MKSLIFGLSICLSQMSLATAFTMDGKNGKTEFLAVGRPSALRISGKGTGPNGQLDLLADEANFLLQGQVDMDLTTFETGISMRDRHMKEKYLEIEKFPKATLVMEAVRISKDVLDKGGTLNFPAKLTLHGIEKPVAVALTLEAHGGGWKALSKFKIRLSDFAIEVPRFSGVTVADEVEVSTEAEVPMSILGKTL